MSFDNTYNIGVHKDWKLKFIPCSCFLLCVYKHAHVFLMYCFTTCILCRTHVTWMRSFTDGIKELREYVQSYHATGLLWNAEVCWFVYSETRQYLHHHVINPLNIHTLISDYVLSVDVLYFRVPISRVFPRLEPRPLLHLVQVVPLHPLLLPSNHPLMYLQSQPLQVTDLIPPLCLHPLTKDLTSQVVRRFIINNHTLSISSFIRPKEGH